MSMTWAELLSWYEKVIIEIISTLTLINIINNKATGDLQPTHTVTVSSELATINLHPPEIIEGDTYLEVYRVNFQDSFKDE